MPRVECRPTSFCNFWASSAGLLPLRRSAGVASDKSPLSSDWVN